MPALPPHQYLAYFHGMPGSPGEWALCAPAHLREAAWLPDRNDPAMTAPVLAEAVAARFPEGAVLVGFSMGAFAALQVAARLGGQIKALHLISPAAPLQLGHFLPQMAGGPLFTLAARRPRLFALAVATERLLARHAPHFLFDRLFATAQGGDTALRQNPVFRSAMAAVLRMGLGHDSRGFADEVRGYVGDWRGVLGKVSAPVTIWQGGADNWTPPAMAQALNAALPGSRLIMLDGCSHYSALRESLTRLGQAPQPRWDRSA